MNRLSDTVFPWAAVAVLATLLLSSEVSTSQSTVPSLSAPLRQPVWDSIKIDDHTDTRLYQPPSGYRFVLTDM
jgi:hypothetical protein